MHFIEDPPALRCLGEVELATGGRGKAKGLRDDPTGELDGPQGRGMGMKHRIGFASRKAAAGLSSAAGKMNCH